MTSQHAAEKVAGKKHFIRREIGSGPPAPSANSHKQTELTWVPRNNMSWNGTFREESFKNARGININEKVWKIGLGDSDYLVSLRREHTPAGSVSQEQDEYKISIIGQMYQKGNDDRRIRRIRDSDEKAHILRELARSPGAAPLFKEGTREFLGRVTWW